VLTILLAARHKRAHPALTPAGEGWYSIYLPRRDGRLSWPSKTTWRENANVDRSDRSNHGSERGHVTAKYLVVSSAQMERCITGGVLSVDVRSVEQKMLQVLDASI